MSENQLPEPGGEMPDSYEFDLLEDATEQDNPNDSSRAINWAYSTSPLSERSLPHSKDAEIALLSAILRDNAALGNISVLRLNPKDFFRSAHERIFLAMHRMSLRGISIDFATLAVELERTGELDEVGGRYYLKALLDYPKSDAIEGHVKIIQDKAHLRALIFTLTECLTSCYESIEPARRLYGETLQKIWELGPRFLDMPE